MKTKKQEHTASPWRFVKTYPIERSSYTVQAGDSPVETIARVLWHGNQAEANAALIAASPDMLSVLQELVALIGDPDGSTLDEAYDKAVAVIAKAKGGV